MAKAKLKTFVLVWRTTNQKYQIAPGADIADAFAKAGYGGGATRALDFYADISPLVASKSLIGAMRAVAGWGSTYYWKRASCAKLAKMVAGDLLLEVPAGVDQSGWQPGPAWSVIDNYLVQNGK